MIGLSRARPQNPGLERKCSWLRELQKKYLDIFVLYKNFKTSGQGYIDKKVVVFNKIQNVSQGENPLQAFLFFVNFTSFVSVEQGDITFF